MRGAAPPADAEPFAAAALGDPLAGAPDRLAPRGGDIPRSDEEPCRPLAPPEDWALRLAPRPPGWGVLEPEPGGSGVGQERPAPLLPMLCF